MATIQNKEIKGVDVSSAAAVCDMSNDDVLKFKRRMLEWPNPVEYVNNMYGCHPKDDDDEYFRAIFAR